jgi:nitric oxide reductase NorE protein
MKIRRPVMRLKLHRSEVTERVRKSVTSEGLSSEDSRADTKVGSTGSADRHVPGEPGLWVLLFGDMAVFTALFTVFLHDRGHMPDLFAESQSHLHRDIGAINTLVLLTSSILIVLSLRACRYERTRYLTTRLGVAAISVGLCFIVLKLFEYYELTTAGINLTTNPFFMWYFAITALHLGHVVIGLAVLTVLIRLMRDTNAADMHMFYFEGGACFWHVVDLLWIVIFPLLYLVR